jgi:hypothetical protein
METVNRFQILHDKTLILLNNSWGEAEAPMSDGQGVSPITIIFVGVSGGKGHPAETLARPICDGDRCPIVMPSRKTTSRYIVEIIRRSFQ